MTISCARASGPRRQSVWTFDQACERGAFRQRHFARGLAEVTSRRCFRSIKPASEINPVQIQLHDFLFAEVLFDSLRQKKLEQLAAKRFLLERKTVARQLLCNRACTLAHMAGRQILKCCTDDPEQIVAVVLIKLCVLDGHNGLDEIGRQLAVRHRLAVLNIDLAEDLAVAIENHAR